MNICVLFLGLLFSGGLLQASSNLLSEQRRGRAENMGNLTVSDSTEKKSSLTLPDGF